MIALKTFLDAKPLYYDKIDYDRMPNAYASIKAKLRLPNIIHIVGTNGKGTTGRFLANALWRSGLNVGHYTSPHILQFNERIWINGESVSDETLEVAHAKLLGLLDPADAEALSYFEYTTLLAIIVYEVCDWVILEAGLGGEHDATNVFPKQLSIFTPIDFDHQAFLGSDIETIATTKIRSIAPHAVIAKQPHDETYRVFDVLCSEYQSNGHRVQELLENADLEMVESIAVSQKLPNYLKENLMSAVAAMKAISIAPKIDYFGDQPLFGRLSRLNDQVWVDVGHNKLAALAIAQALSEHKVVLVYNSYKDKAYKEILATLKAIIKRVEIIDVEDDRIESREKLEDALEQNGIEFDSFTGIQKDEEYLVFGSFSVVEKFMKEYNA